MSCKSIRQRIFSLVSALALLLSLAACHANDELCANGHTAATAWTIGDDGTHYHVCPICGGNKTDVASHTYDEVTHLCICGAVDPSLPTASAVTFCLESETDGVTITVYDTQDTDADGTVWKDGTTVYAKTSDGTVSCTGEEQVNFRVSTPEGYCVTAVTATEGCYKNIKTVSASEGIFRVTKITGDLTITVTIGKAEETAPTAIKPTAGVHIFPRTGALITYLPDNFDPATMTITGNTASDVGEYTAVVSLKNPEELTWADGSTDPVSLSWSITSTDADWTVERTEDNTICVTHTENGSTHKATFSYAAGTEFTLDPTNGTLTFTYDGTAADELVYTMEGTYDGAIAFQMNDSCSLTVELSGFTLTAAEACPLSFTGADQVDLSAKKGTVNTILDQREATEEEKGAIVADCDLKLKGAGTLSVVSDHNNGIHSKDDLTVQKLTLSVDCQDNALKGNDSVTILSGDLTLIARSGDGIKTSNSSLSSSGKQKGTVTIHDGKLVIRAACDGIDAAYDVIQLGGTLDIATDQYADLTGDSTAYAVSRDTTSSSDNSTAGVATLASFGPGGMGGGPGGGPGGGTGGGPGGGPGGDQGNTDKGDYSTKGIKAGNAVTISGGTVTIEAYDDAIHANNDTTLESGATPTGRVTVSGGALTLSSNDDAIHGDGSVLISGGTVNILRSYEGIEGDTVEIAGGDVSVISSDDGLNGTATTGTAITVSGGTLYVLAGGDGVDSNSQSSYEGILFSGGRSVILSYGQADSSIDTERGYSYTGGLVVGIGIAGGMSGESTNCKNFSSVGKSTSLRLSQNAYLNLPGILSLCMPVSINALVVVLGNTSVSPVSATSGLGTPDANGVAWLIS